MKKIECILPDNKFHDLQNNLRDFGIHGMTVTEVKGFGNEQVRPESFIFLPKKKIEIFCKDEDVEGIVNNIISTCQSGKMGDGKIAIYEIGELIRIRTEERGEVAV